MRETGGGTGAPAPSARVAAIGEPSVNTRPGSQARWKKLVCPSLQSVNAHLVGRHDDQWPHDAATWGPLGRIEEDRRAA